MGLYVRQDQNRTELQERIAAELQEKAKNRSKQQDTPDGVDDSKYIEGTKRTTSLAWAWLLIGIATIVVIVWLVVESTKR